MAFKFHPKTNKLKENKLKFGFAHHCLSSFCGSSKCLQEDQHIKHSSELRSVLALCKWRKVEGIYLPKSHKTDKDSAEHTAQSLSICCFTARLSHPAAGEG